MTEDSVAVILALQGDHHDFAADIGFGFLDRLILLRAKASRKMKRSSLVGYLSLAALLLTPLRIAGQTGELRVVVATSGSRVDANGYIVAIDTLRRSVAADDSVVFTNVKLGIQTAELLDVAEACIIPEGNPRKVVVRLSVKGWPSLPLLKSPPRPRHAKMSLLRLDSRHRAHRRWAIFLLASGSPRSNRLGFPHTRST
jgi:hypothetical protein